MPKKAPKNAFFYYMQHFKEEEKKKGIIYENTARLANAAGPSWKEASAEVHSKFEAMAKNIKLKSNLTDEKYTSTGIPLSHIAKLEQEKQRAEENEREDISEIVKMNVLKQCLLDQDFYIMDVNFYCKTNTHYIIGESTLLRFNLRDGVKDTYHEIINPGKIPMGYMSEVKHGSQEFSLDMPDETAHSDYIKILANMIDYLKQNRDVKILPPIFTLQEKVQPICDFIMQMCYQADEDERLFRIYKLETLFFMLANGLRSNENEGFPKESLAQLQLKKDLFKYSPGIGCAHHEEKDASVECSLSRAKRWTYTMLDMCCGLAAVPLVPGRHVPQDYDLDSIHTYQEQKRCKSGPSLASRAPSSCNTSVLNDSVDESSFASKLSIGTKKESRVHVPLRMPKTNYSSTIQQAPDLTENDFPSLPSRAGRGRGVGGSFSKRK